MRAAVGMCLIALAGAIIAAGALYTTPSAQPGAARSLSTTASFAGVSLRLDYATTTAAQELGLGGRASIPGDYGLLFVFARPDYYGFWMKDMQVPIDIFWLGEDGRVVAVNARVATSTYPRVFYPPEPVRYVLETAAGFAEAHAVATGTPLMLQN